MKSWNATATKLSLIRSAAGPRHWRRRGVLPVVFAIAMAACLATAPQSRATLINYTISDTTYVVDENRAYLAYTVTAVGTFTFDTTDDYLSNVDVTLTNAYDNGGTNVLTSAYNPLGSSNSFYLGTTFDPDLFINTSGSLESDSPESIVGSAVYVNGYGTETSGSAGSIIPVLAPEPASFVLLGECWPFWAWRAVWAARLKSCRNAVALHSMRLRCRKELRTGLNQQA